MLRTVFNLLCITLCAASIQAAGQEASFASASSLSSKSLLPPQPTEPRKSFGQKKMVPRLKRVKREYDVKPKVTKKRRPVKIVPESERIEQYFIKLDPEHQVAPTDDLITDCLNNLCDSILDDSYFDESSLESNAVSSSSLEPTVVSGDQLDVAGFKDESQAIAKPMRQWLYWSNTESDEDSVSE